MKIKRALVSVYNKTGIVDFCKELQKLGIEIISTGRTAKLLRENGIRVLEVSEITKFPEMLDGRVKTLHPKIHGGILAIRDKDEHIRQIREQGIEPIDLVVVNLYPFEEVVAKGASLEEAIENIDIGGPAMVRSAAKNYKYVGVIVDPEDYPKILEEIRNTGELSEKTREMLAVKAFLHTARYDAIISNYLGSVFEYGDFPEIFNLSYRKIAMLRYGENPHQRGVLYSDGSKKGIANAEFLQGKELSYNNLLDAEAGWKLVNEFKEPAAVIIKHGNPCGVACASDLQEAYSKAYECDPVSAYGGIVAVNGKVTPPLAEKIISVFLEVLCAPDYDKEALKILEKKPNLRVLRVSGDFERIGIRQISGGLLVQDEDLVDLKPEELKVVTKKKPGTKELEDLLFAWKVVKHVKSNAIVLAKDKQTVGIGAGQMSRVDSTEIAIRKAGERSKGSVLASDGFIPFPDTVQKAAEAGVTAIIQPGGSIRDQQIIDAADDLGISMVFTGIRHFRH
ncbi:MAG: bifunctional phosphoribosylaminoimidazolecarboxamide formyltransferase/IMP cyclohydrolase [Candidatus Hadarchaeales archaeon]